MKTWFGPWVRNVPSIYARCPKEELRNQIESEMSLRVALTTSLTSVCEYKDGSPHTETCFLSSAIPRPHRPPPPFPSFLPFLPFPVVENHPLNNLSTAIGVEKCLPIDPEAQSVRVY